MSGKNPHMDERMLWIRGNVFKHSFLMAIALLFVNAVVQDLYGPWATPWYQNLLLMFLLITTASVELIVREVYATAPHATMRLIMAILSMSGLSLLILAAKHLLVDGLSLWQAGQLTDTGCSLAMGVMNLVIPVAFVVRHHVTKRRQADEED